MKMNTEVYQGRQITEKKEVYVIFFFPSLGETRVRFVN